MIQDDRTRYDIGEPFVSIRYDNGTIAHTPKGIVLSCDNGTRYTCSYTRLSAMLKNSCRIQDNFIEETNINDIVGEFKNYVNKLKKEAEKINEQLNNK